jgi:outer membrane protein OmpA-like peptidoglycan-associated protein
MKISLGITARNLLVVALAGLMALATTAQAQNVARGEQVGRIQWGVWVDPDGCMHWMADGGIEQYQVNRLDPETGRPVCLQIDTCFMGDADTMFETDSARLTAPAVDRLRQVFSQPDVFGYAVYGHTDSRASHAYNQTLSEHRARSVGNVGRSVGAVIEREIGFGETRPRASNGTADGMRQNRRVEVICYRW